MIHSSSTRRSRLPPVHRPGLVDAASLPGKRESNTLERLTFLLLHLIQLRMNQSRLPPHPVLQKTSPAIDLQHSLDAHRTVAMLDVAATDVLGIAAAGWQHP
jgi:hypothetical protein